MRELAAGYGDKIHRRAGRRLAERPTSTPWCATATEAFGGLDIVVNNAGVTHRNQPLLEVSEAEFDRIYAVNVKSIYLTTLAAVPEMEKRGGGSSSTPPRPPACARAPASPGTTARRAP